MIIAAVTNFTLELMRVASESSSYIFFMENAGFFFFLFPEPCKYRKCISSDIFMKASLQQTNGIAIAGLIWSRHWPCLTGHSQRTLGCTLLSQSARAHLLESSSFSWEFYYLNSSSSFCMRVVLFGIKFIIYLLFSAEEQSYMCVRELLGRLYWPTLRQALV